ncbi:MAG: hypothetical protein JWL89_572 [Candidatus Saccharibacteria bacterium]|nr:hypothetical protein [Candidatus Saccharibacteria bacterium]
MKRIFAMLSLALLLFLPALAFPGQSAAVNIFPNTCDKYQAKAIADQNNAPSVCQDVENPQTGNPIVRILKGAINVLSYVVGIAAIIGLLASGIRMITANGDSNAVATARTAFAYSLIGVVVVVFSQAIVVFVLNKI